MAERFLELQQSQRVGLWRYLRHSRWPVVLTASLIYAGLPVFALLNAFISLYQAVCFPIYGIPRVRRLAHLVFDRSGLPYLNLVEKFNCFYCSYGNGVVSYAREVAARTEQYWCPIKHARPLVCPPGNTRNSLHTETAKRFASVKGACARSWPRATGVGAIATHLRLFETTAHRHCGRNPLSSMIFVHTFA